jgi:N-methylhydantoinase A
MQASAAAFVRHGVGDTQTQTRITAFMRYRGQGWEIPVPVPAQNFATDDVSLFTAEFEKAYRGLFGRTIEDLDIEIANWSVVVATPQRDVKRVQSQSRLRPAASSSRRRFFDAQAREFVEGPEIMREDLAPGDFVDGPAVIVEDETCTIVTGSFSATAQADGALLLNAKQDGETG